MTAPITGKSILLVDDLPDNLSVLYDFLQSAGFKVLVAEDGPRAIAIAAARHPDLILLDATMPGMDGFETCRRLRAGPAAETPIIFVSARSDTVDKVRGLEVGGVDYVTKPFQCEEVLARVRTHLELTALREALRAKNAALETANEALDGTVQQLRRAEAALRSALQDPVLVVDDGGEVLFCADTARAMLQRIQQSTTPNRLPGPVLAWIRGGSGAYLELDTVDGSGRRVRLSSVRDDMHADRRLLRLELLRPEPSPALLKPLGLTPRETEILFWIAQGKTTPDIAGILGTAAETVKKQATSILAKLGVESRLAAALTATRLLDGEPGATEPPGWRDSV